MELLAFEKGKKVMEDECCVLLNSSHSCTLPLTNCHAAAGLCLELQHQLGSSLMAQRLQVLHSDWLTAAPWYSKDTSWQVYNDMLPFAGQAHCCNSFAFYW